MKRPVDSLREPLDVMFIFNSKLRVSRHPLQSSNQTWKSKSNKKRVLFSHCKIMSPIFTRMKIALASVSFTCDLVNYSSRRFRSFQFSHEIILRLRNSHLQHLLNTANELLFAFLIVRTPALLLKSQFLLDTSNSVLECFWHFIPCHNFCSYPAVQQEMRYCYMSVQCCNLP